MIFRLSNFRTPIRHALRTVLAHQIKFHILGFTLGGFRVPSPPRFKFHLDLRSNERMRAEIERLNGRTSIQTKEGIDIAPKIELNCLQKSYRADKPNFDPRIDRKPVFRSSYSSQPAAISRSGGLRGGAARGGRKGRL